MSSRCLPPINVTLKTVSPSYPNPDGDSQRVCNSNNQSEQPTCIPCPTDFCSVGSRCPDGNAVEIVVGLKSKFEPKYVPPAAPIDGRTTYKNNFVAHPLGFTKVLPIRPTAGNTLPRVFQQINDCKTDDLTWYKYQFPPHKVVPFQKPTWSKRTAIAPLPGPMFSVTCYNQAYQPKQGKPAESAKPKHRFLQKSEEMDCSTSYQTAYQAWCMERTNSMKPHDRPGFVNDCCTPFRGISTYKNCGIYYFTIFVVSFPKELHWRLSRWLPEPRVSYKPKYTPAVGGFPYISTYRAAYEPYYFKTKPCIPGSEYDMLLR